MQTHILRSSQYRICKKSGALRIVSPITYYLVNVAAGPGEKMVHGHPIAHLASNLAYSLFGQLGLLL